MTAARMSRKGSCLCFRAAPNVHVFLLQHDNATESHVVIPPDTPTGERHDLAETQVRMESKILCEEREVPQKGKFPMEIVGNNHESTWSQDPLCLPKKRDGIRSDGENEEKHRGIK